MRTVPLFGWTAHGSGGYWHAGNLRVSTHGRGFNAYRILNDGNVEHVLNAAGKIKHFRKLSAAMCAAEELWRKP